MLIAKVENNIVHEIADHTVFLTHVSFPPSGPDITFLKTLNFYPVNTFKPHDRNTQKLSSAPPYLEDDYVYTVIVEDYTQEELEQINITKGIEIRTQRESLLSQTVDKINPLRWEAMTEEKKEEWRLYRQALLDITLQETFPTEVTWPTKPE